jgi:hypothetical protein
MIPKIDNVCMLMFTNISNETRENFCISKILYIIVNYSGCDSTIAVHSSYFRKCIEELINPSRLAVVLVCVWYNTLYDFNIYVSILNKLENKNIQKRFKIDSKYFTK